MQLFARNFSLSLFDLAVALEFNSYENIFDDLTTVKASSFEDDEVLFLTLVNSMQSKSHMRKKSI